MGVLGIYSVPVGITLASRVDGLHAVVNLRLVVYSQDTDSGRGYALAISYACHGRGELPSANFHSPKSCGNNQLGYLASRRANTFNLTSLDNRIAFAVNPPITVHPSSPVHGTPNTLKAQTQRYISHELPYLLPRSPPFDSFFSISRRNGTG